MKYEKWNIGEPAEQTVCLLREAGYPYLLSAVLASRGVAAAEEAQAYLKRDGKPLYSPLLMKDMDRAVARIRRAVAEGETIAVFGDYDVDGITSTVLLRDYLQSRGANCLRYIPRRIEDGYGLSGDAIRRLREQGASLLVTVDCGITGNREVEYANSIGMDVVVTDHHECKGELPAAVAVVNPHRHDCPYPFKSLAGVGVALKLVLALGGPERAGELFTRYCTLAAIGTVADVMAMEDENRAIVYSGLRQLPKTDFVGVHALLKEAGLSGKPITSIQIGFVLAPRINAAGRMGAADVAADLLETSDPVRAEELAKDLCELNRRRQTVEQEICTEAMAQIDLLPEESRSALVLASEHWHQGVVGIVASRLSEKYACPSFMIHLTDGMGKGSCRSWGGFNLFAALEACSDLLEGFGGHELAAGFTIREENILPFREKMNRYVRESTGGRPPVSVLNVDAAVAFPADVTAEEVEALSALEPFGAGNPRPVFALLGATVDAIQSVGQGKHLKLRISKGRTIFNAIFFSVTQEACGLNAGDRVDAAFYFQINEFRGSRSLQMQLVDLRPSRSPSRHEAEAISLCRRCRSGGDLTAREITRLHTTREQFGAYWRALQRHLRNGAMEGGTLPILRLLAEEAGGLDSFLRADLALSVFYERGLLELICEEDRLFVKAIPVQGKADLSACPYLMRLTEPSSAKRR